MFEKILVAIDGSEGSKKALATAIAIARRFGLELQSISVKERPNHYATTIGEVMEEQEEADKVFAKVTEESKELARQQGVYLECTVLAGDKVESIIKFAREGHYDLLVAGFTGYSGIFGQVWGGTSQNLTKTAPCSVLVVK